MTHLIDTLGGPAAVARAVGCKPPSVIEWRRRGIPPERRPDLERHFWPQVTVEQMGDEVQWVRVADADWPNPQGRPCLDVWSGAAHGGTVGAVRAPEHPADCGVSSPHFGGDRGLKR